MFLRRYALGLCIIFSCLPTAAHGVMPFHELAHLDGHPSYWYEQRRLPRKLRHLMMGVQMAPEAKGNPKKWCKRVKSLFGDTTLPRATHYVAPHYAPNTHDCIRSMCNRLKIEMPLLFVSPRGGQAQTVNLCLLSGGFHALVFDATKIGSRSVQECKAIVAHELAHIARRHRQKEKVARYVWPCVLGFVATGYAAYRLREIFQEKSVDARWNEVFREAKKQLVSWGLTFAVAGGTWVISEIVQAEVRRKHEREADKLAAEAFDGGMQLYVDCVRRVETDEVMAHKRKRQEFVDGCVYVERQIEQLREYKVSSQIVAFFSNHLRNNLKKSEPKPADAVSVPFEPKPSTDERLAYLEELTRKKGR